jgi:hypothetical protein
LKFRKLLAKSFLAWLGLAWLSFLSGSVDIGSCVLFHPFLFLSYLQKCQGYCERERASEFFPSELVFLVSCKCQTFEAEFLFLLCFSPSVMGARRLVYPSLP